MRQLPLADLRLSVALEAADPSAISRQGLAAAHAAGEMQAQAARLEALGARMQTGFWISPAGAAFVGTSAEQSRRLRVAGDLLHELSAALSTLAAGLLRARADALTAVVRGRRLDAAAAELNHRVRVQHSLLLQDPDSRLLSERAADELTAAMQAAAEELAGAERRARYVWQHAAAAFDRVGYATPVMRLRVEESAWDPATSVSLAAAASRAKVTSCGVMDELALPPNGVLTGPDGRAYPLVVQTARDRDGRLLVSTREVPDPRGNWQALAVRYGTTAYGRKAGAWEKVAVAVGGAAGAAYPEGSTFAPELLPELHIMAGGGAYLPEVPSTGGDPVKEVPAGAPHGKKHAEYWIRPMTGLAGGRRAAAPDAIGLIDAGIGGFLLAKHLDDSRAAGYRVVFEEDSAGQRRARLQLFRVMTPPDEAPLTVAAGGYVDPAGHLAGIPVTGEAPDLRPIMTPGR